MNEALATIEKDKEISLALKDSLYPGAKDESIKMVLAYCRAAGLDPMMKPVHIVPMSVKSGNGYVYRDVVMPGIDLYRTKAHRTGEYMGMSEPEFGPDITHEFQGKISITFPQWCKITVKRLVNGHIVEYPHKEYWMESYATGGKDTNAPNAMWKKRPYGQLAKCAEAGALRKGFPEIGAQPTAEEMEGKELMETDITPKPEPIITQSFQVPSMPKVEPKAEVKAEAPKIVEAELVEPEVSALPKENPLVQEVLQSIVLINTKEDAIAHRRKHLQTLLKVSAIERDDLVAAFKERLFQLSIPLEDTTPSIKPQLLDRIAEFKHSKEATNWLNKHMKEIASLPEAEKNDVMEYYKQINTNLLMEEHGEEGTQKPEGDEINWEAELATAESIEKSNEIWVDYEKTSPSGPEKVKMRRVKDKRVVELRKAE